MADALRESVPGLEVEPVPIRTGGDDRRRHGPDPEDKARFVKEIEDALLAGEIDLAVHSAKDVPGELPQGLAIVGVPERADPADALCGAASLDELPSGAAVGTASLRRRAQLLAYRPDLEVRPLRGNVDTRLRRLEQSDLAAIVLAAAGLERLGLAADGVLAAEVMTPAPGQGCLALEARVDDERARALAEQVTDRGSLLRLTAERALVGALDASCRTPVAAHAELADGELRLSAFAGLPDGSVWVRDVLAHDPEEPAELGQAVARRMLAAGAAELLEAVERGAGGEERGGPRG